MKICTKCKKELPATSEYFYKDKNAKDGLCTQCKSCRQADYKTKYETSFKEKKKIYRKENAEIIKEKRNIWRKKEENVIKIKTQQKLWLDKNKESYNAWRDKWRDNNKNKINLQQKKWNKANPIKAKWYQLRHRCGINTPNLQVFADLFVKHKTPNNTYTCEYCNKELELKDTTIDHKIPLSKGGDDRIENLAICCSDCNVKKFNNILPQHEYLQKEFSAVV